MEKLESLPVGLQIKKTSHHIRRFIDSFVNEKMDWELTSIEGITVGRLFGLFHQQPNKEVTAADVMRIANINKSATSKLINNLVQKGYIKVSQSKKDGRFKIIELTKKAHEKEQVLDKLFKEINAELESCLNKDEIANLNRYLIKIQNHLSNKGGK